MENVLKDRLPKLKPQLSYYLLNQLLCCLAHNSRETVTQLTIIYYIDYYIVSTQPHNGCQCVSTHQQRKKWNTSCVNVCVSQPVLVPHISIFPENDWYSKHACQNSGWPAHLRARKRIHSSHVVRTKTCPTWQPPLMVAISAASHQLTCQPNLATLKSFKRIWTKPACLRYQRGTWQLPTSHSGAVTFFNTELAECKGHFEWTSKAKALHRSLWTDGDGEGFPSSYVTDVGTFTSSWGFLRHD